MMQPLTAQSFVKRRSIRVFISSTFKDMNDEREALIKHVFPELQKICAKRKVAWNEVDLRWGVPSEESAHVLPTCLAEIDNCRPFFIGLLGNRYGHIPEVEDTAATEMYPWLKKARGRSITELEIMHGVLNDPSRAGHAYFYFKSGSADHAWTEEDPEQAAKLQDLKGRIVQSGLPVKAYADLEELKRAVQQDFTALIDRLYPPGEIIDELDREANEHEIYAMERSKVYVGRSETFSMLDEFANGDGKPLIVTGPSGSGKTSLLANWALRFLESGRCHGNGNGAPNLIMHFIGASAYSADWTVLVKRLLGELKRRAGIDADIPEDEEGLKQALGEWLSQTEKMGKTVIVLDGLNQLSGNEDGAKPLAWLPEHIPGHIRLIVSALPGDVMDELLARDWTPFEVEPLIREEREALIRKYLSQYGKTLEHLAEEIVESPQTGNPLYLRILLEELRVYGNYDTLDAKVRELLAADSIESLYSIILSRLDADYGKERPNLVKDVLSCLWASRKGLTEGELRQMLGTGGDDLPQAWLSPLLIVLEQSLINRSGSISLFHDYLRNAVEERYFPTSGAKAAVHRRLADFFETQSSLHRRLEELPWQLAKAEEWMRLYQLLQAQEFWCALWEQSPYDVKHYWGLIEENTKPWRQSRQRVKTPELRLVDAFQAYIDAPGSYEASIVHNVAQLLMDRYPEEALILLTELEKRYSEKREYDRLQQVKGNIAAILYIQTKLDKAIAYLREQEELCREYQYTEGLYQSLLKQADIQLYRSEHVEAMKLLQELEQWSGDRSRERHLLLKKAAIKRLTRQWEDALELLEQHQRMCIEFGDKFDYQESLGLQGLILKEQGNLEAARRLFVQQEELCRSIGSLSGVQKALARQADIMWMLGDHDAVEELIRKQENLSIRLKSRDVEQQIIGQKVKYVGDKFSPVNQLKLLEEQEAICRQIGNQQSLQECLCRKSHVLLKLKDKERATAAVHEAEQICRVYAIDIGLQYCLGQKSHVYEERGEFQAALEAAKEQQTFSRSIGYHAGFIYGLEREAWLLIKLGKYDRSAACFEQLQQDAEVDAERLARSFYGLATALYKKGANEEARNAVLRGIEHYESLRRKIMVKKSYLLLEKIEKGLEEGDEAAAAALQELEERVIRTAIQVVGSTPNATFQTIAEHTEAVMGDVEAEHRHNRLVSILHQMRNRRLLTTVKKENRGKRFYQLTPYGEQMYKEISGDGELSLLKERQRHLVNSFIQEAEQWLQARQQVSAGAGNILLADIDGRPATVVLHGEMFTEQQFRDALDQAESAQPEREPLYILVEQSYHLHQIAMMHYYRWLKERHLSQDGYTVALRIQSLERFRTDGEIPWQEVNVRVAGGKLTVV